MHLPKVLITTAMAVAMMMIPPSIDAQPVNTIVTMQESDMYNIYKEEYMDDAAQGSSITKIKTLLVNHAKDSQKYVVRLLSKHPDVQYRSFWISNQLVVLNASPELVKELQKTRHVQEVRQEEILPLPSYPVPPSQVSAFNGNQTTFANIQVSEAWANGFTGKNIVVGSIGSGVRYTHKSLRSNFHKRFGWLDPLQHSTVPTDSHGISTHAVGLMVGRDGTGVAPDAQWMACKACQDDGCHESHLLECAQFMTCPTNTNGENPDCHQGASVIHNAWTGSSTQATFYRNVFRLWKYVSKTPVFAAGDKGSECSTIGTIESTPNVLTVGAATDQYKLAPFSSRGTSQVHMYEVKPDLIAPGINLISVAHDSDQGLVQVTGTQAASAVAAGSLLLLLSQRPSLSNPDVRQIFMTNSVAWKSNEDEMEGGNDCGAPSDANSNGYPNANMGWGNLNLHLALDVLRVKSTVPDCRILGRAECLSRKNDCDWYWREYRCAWKQYVPPFTAYCNALPHKMCIYTRLCYFSSDDDICYPLVGA